MLYFIAVVCMVSLIVSLITLHKVFGLRGLITYELSVFEGFMRTRIDAFLNVFRKGKGGDKE